jgi:hypothetical protein
MQKEYRTIYAIPRGPMDISYLMSIMTRQLSGVSVSSQAAVPTTSQLGGRLRNNVTQPPFYERHNMARLFLFFLISLSSLQAKAETVKPSADKLIEVVGMAYALDDMCPNVSVNDDVLFKIINRQTPEIRSEFYSRSEDLYKSSQKQFDELSKSKVLSCLAVRVINDKVGLEIFILNE